MKPAAPVDHSAANQAGSRTKKFSRYRGAPLLTPAQTKRQDDVLRCAWRHFGEAGPVIAFLNTRHDELNGQPLRLAIESDDGLMRVATLLAEMTLKT